MADTTLWCVEDGEGVHAMPSKSEAYRYAKRMRAMVKMLHRESPSPYWPPVWEEVKPWMYDMESHQEEVERYLEGKRKEVKSPRKRRTLIASLPPGKRLFF